MRRDHKPVRRRALRRPATNTDLAIAIWALLIAAPVAAFFLPHGP